MQGNTYCFVPECKSSQLANPDKLFFPVPFGLERKDWFQAAKRHEFLYRSHLSICQDHFDLEKDVVDWSQLEMLRDADGNPCKPQLRKGVVPHKFHCQLDRPPENRQEPALVEKVLLTVSEARPCAKGKAAESGKKSALISTGSAQKPTVCIKNSKPNILVRQFDLMSSTVTKRKSVSKQKSVPKKSVLKRDKPKPARLTYAEKLEALRELGATFEPSANAKTKERLSVISHVDVGAVINDANDIELERDPLLVDESELNCTSASGMAAGAIKIEPIQEQKKTKDSLDELLIHVKEETPAEANQNGSDIEQERDPLLIVGDGSEWNATSAIIKDEEPNEKMEDVKLETELILDDDCADENYLSGTSPTSLEHSPVKMVESILQKYLQNPKETSQPDEDDDFCEIVEENASTENRADPTKYPTESSGENSLPGNFHCTYCSERFKSKQLFDHHLYRCKTRHDHRIRLLSLLDVRPYSCTECSAKFKTKPVLEQHIATHSEAKPFSCPESQCSSRFRTKKLLREHSLIHFAKKKPFEKSSDISTEKFSCNYCGYRCGTKAALDQHSVIHIREVKIVSNTIKCTQKTVAAKDDGLNEKIGDALEMELTLDESPDNENHLSGIAPELPQHQSTKSCFHENLELPVKTNPENCLEDVEFCEIVPENVGSNKEIREKLTIESLLISEKEKAFHCPFCLERFEQLINLEEHKSIHAEAKSYTCNKCSAIFRRKDHRDEHLTTHTEERPFACTKCSHRAKSKRALLSHLGTHTVGKPHTCLYCSKKFKRKQLLSEHVTTHFESKIFFCSQCSYQCQTKRTLCQHLLVHQGETLPANRCSVESSQGSIELESDPLLIDAPAWNAMSVRTEEEGSGVNKGGIKLATELTLNDSGADEHSITGTEFISEEYSGNSKNNAELENSLEDTEYYEIFEEKDVASNGIVGGSICTKQHKAEFCEGNFNKKKRKKTHSNEKSSLRISRDQCVAFQSEKLYAEDNRYFCDQCSFWCRLKNTLTQHKLSHAEVQYTCDHCSKAFSTKASLTTHLAAHLQEGVFSFAPSQMFQEKVFSCRQCSSQFLNAYALRRHLYLVHLKAKTSYSSIANTIEYGDYKKSVEQTSETVVQLE